MTIHHDKTIYGKVYSGSETISEDALNLFLKELNEDESLFAAKQAEQETKSRVKKGDTDDFGDKKDNCRG